MSTFKTFMTLTKKALPNSIAFFIVFVIITILTTSFSLENENTYSDQKVDIAVIDNDNSELSKALYTYLDKIHNITDIENDKEKMTEALFTRNVKYILTIPKGFENSLTQGTTDYMPKSSSYPGSTYATLCDNQVNNYIKYLTLYLNSSDTIKEAVENTNNTISISSETILHQNESNHTSDDGVTFYFQYIPYILISTLILSLGTVLITFRQKDINARLQCSATSLTRRNVALIAGTFVYSLGCYFAFVILALIVYGKKILTLNGLLYAGNTFVFLMFCMGLVFLLSFIVSNADALSSIANVFGLGLSFLGGIFVPLELLSEKVIPFSRFLPTYWYVKANEICSLYTGDSAMLTKYGKYIFVEFLFAIAVFVAGLIASKVKTNNN